jgi:hypothetical protein
MKRKRQRTGSKENGEAQLIVAASERAYYDALHQHFLDLAYERLKDPEYRVILEEFLEKTHRFLARKSKAQKQRPGTRVSPD